MPKWLVAALVVPAAVGIGAIGIYNHQIKLSWDEIRDPWRANERVLARTQQAP